MSEHFDHHEIKRRLAFLDLLAHEGIAMRRSGPNWIGPCPFHDERSGSFTVHGPLHDHGHCYGCGWNGDIFDLWQQRHGVVFAEAVRALASLAQVSPGVFEAKRKQASQVTRLAGAPRGNSEKPTLPAMRGLLEEEIVRLAALRHLDAAGVRAAARTKRVGMCNWPQFLDRDGAWRKAKDIAPSWVVTDSERRVAQFRRMDGVAYTIKRGDKTDQLKAWTKGSPTWPLGASEMGTRANILIVEGGADMLAAYHFLALFHQLETVAVCAILGASCAICDAALPHFRRKRVRIMMDEDTPRPVPGHPEKPPIYPGREAAARWTAQLVAVGAVVETFSLAGLVKRDGTPVKDLNDLALVEEGAWVDPELREAFFDFDF